MERQGAVRPTILQVKYYALFQTFFQAELKRLCAMFRVVPNFHWIVVEDSASKTRVGYFKNRNPRLNPRLLSTSHFFLSVKKL